MTGRDEKFMAEALRLAREAADDGEVPVGAVVVLGDEIIGEGRNRRERNKDAAAHAEIEAIKAACGKLHSWRLGECEIFVTLEPCPMCAGAIISSRIKRVVFGAFDENTGSCWSVIDLFALPYGHRPEIAGGFMKGECARLLSDFFKARRFKSC